VQREIDVLGRVAPSLPVPVPVPRFVGAPSDAYPWPWFGTEYLHGSELAEAGVADADRAAIGAAMGGFLQALHDPGLASRVAGTLPVDPMRRADMPFRVATARRQLEEVTSARLWHADSAVDALLADAADLPPPSRVVVLHGDLHMRHVLVAPGGTTVAGVIDWGDVCTGDPSVDLSLAYGSFVGAARAAFLERYGPVDRLTELRARVIAVFLAAALLAYADDRRMPALRAESLRSLERAVS
jgi:aminoglycoside phosphotransferase (APT) family kinase protein